MFGVSPSWHILSWFQLIPATHNILQRDVSLAILPGTAGSRIKFSLLVMVAIFLFLMLLQDLLVVFSSVDVFQGGNMITNLFIRLKPFATHWKNLTALLLFAHNPARMRAFIGDMWELVESLQVTKKQKSRHHSVFTVCFYVAALFGIARMILGCVQDLRDQPFWSPTKYGLFTVPNFAPVILDGTADLIGELIALSIYVQITAFANVLVQCCRRINATLAGLRHSLLTNQDNGFQLTAFQDKVYALRDSHENLIQLYNSFEDIFSVQIAFGFINHVFAIFTAVSSFFVIEKYKDNSGILYLYIIQLGMYCSSYLFVMLLLTHYTIFLYDENSKSQELLHDVIYRYQTHRKTEGDVVAVKSSRSGEIWTEDAFVLFGFLQRIVTRPLVVTAGGFVDLTRSFIISIVALIIGFSLFLLEQYQGHQPHVCQIVNGTTMVVD